MSARRFGWAMLFAFAWRQRRGAIGRLALTLAGPLLAVLGFALANTIATSAALVTQHDLAGRRPGPYDLLVRPSGDVSEAERTLRLVAPDELRWGSGITIGQWQAIARLPEVEAAAPVAPAGTLRLVLPAGAACHAPNASGGAGHPTTVVDAAVVGIDPVAETRLVHLDKALRSGALLPAAIPRREWLTPPFLLVAARAAHPPTHRGASSCGEIDALTARGTLGGGLLPPPVDRYVLPSLPPPGVVPAVQRADAAGLPSLPGAATAWLSVGSPAGAIDGVIDSARLSLGDPRLDPLPFALYGGAPGPSGVWAPPNYGADPVLLTDVHAVCRLLGDGCLGSVRVRVAAPGGINGRRAAVVAAVARAIEQRTGLWVDVAYGAAGRAVHVLNAGTNRGDGAAELWLAEGATLSISRGVNAINLLLFGLIGALAVLSTLVDAVVSGLRRAPERELLRHNGWSRSALRRLTLADTTLVGGAAGLLALLLLSALLLAGWTAPSPASWVVLPLTIVSYALGAALGDALTRADRVVGGRGQRPRAGAAPLLPWWLVLALRNAARRPLRAALAILTAAAAATVFTILLLGVTTLHGLLSVTVLGQGVAVELAPYHAGLAAIALVLTLVTLANLGTQGVRERRVELGTLRAVGFSTGAVLRLVAIEAVLTASAGSLLGVATTTLVVVRAYGDAIDRVLLGPAVLASCGAAAVLCTAAAVVPTVKATRIPPAEAQRDG